LNRDFENLKFNSSKFNQEVNNLRLSLTVLDCDRNQIKIFMIKNITIFTTEEIVEKIISK
jgi:hypothetical protein